MNLTIFNSVLRTSVACFALSLFGCAELPHLWPYGDAPVTADAQNPVMRVLSLWQASEGIGLDDKLTRGFQAQVMFFTVNDDLPVKVNGAVRIYVFDDQGSHEEQVKPIHQFDFPPEAWAAHMKIGKLGPAYNVFIPYTRKGHHQAMCSLRVRFTASDGPVVYSDMVNLLMQGTAPEKSKKQDEHLPLRGESEEDADEPTEDENDAATTQASLRASTKDTQSGVRRADLEVPAAAKRPAAVALTPAERKRITEEFMAKQNGDGADEGTLSRAPRRVRQRHLLDDSDDATEQPLPQQRVRNTRKRNPLADVDESDDDAESSADLRSNDLRSTRPDRDAQASGSATRRKLNPLQALEEDEQAEGRADSKRKESMEIEDDVDAIDDQEAIGDLPRRSAIQLASYEETPAAIPRGVRKSAATSSTKSDAPERAAKPKKSSKTQTRQMETYTIPLTGDPGSK